MSRLPSTVALLVMVLLAGACGAPRSSGGAATSSSIIGGSGGLNVAVGSFEVVADRPQRFTVGLLADDGELISFGTVDFAFAYLGTAEAPLDEPRPGPEAQGRFLPVPGSTVPEGEDGPRQVPPSEGVGVYGADGVVFDRPGFWEVVVTTRLDGDDVTASAPFEVLAEPQLPYPGDPAPATRNHVWGTPDVPVEAIDSRAQPGRPDPAPELHGTVIADALAAGRPLVVTVATPVYCQSQFCGPITDEVSRLAARYADTPVAFVHLEVYRDFDSNRVNAAAAEWIKPRDGGEMREPWTFVVGADGRITDRFDNVATTEELDAAVQRVLAG